MQGFNAAFASDGTDWDFVPYDMYLYGGGGIGGWATLCGIANGCPALCNLIGLHGALGSDILGHYASSEWPITATLPDLYYDDNGYGPTNYPSEWAAAKTPMSRDDVLANVIPYSPLCHVSISKWCYAAGVHLGTMGTEGFQHKNDRCGKLASEMAGYTAELINYYALNGASGDTYVIPTDTADCQVCHVKGSTDKGAAQLGKMDCLECHDVGTYHMANKLVLEEVWTEDGSNNRKDTFTAGDPIVAKVRFALLGAGTAYVKTYQSKVKGTCGKFVPCKKNDDLLGGVHEWSWSGTVPGACTGTGKVIMRMKSSHYKGSPVISDVRTVFKFNIV
jgi:hypothetical protein